MFEEFEIVENENLKFLRLKVVFVWSLCHEVSRAGTWRVCQHLAENIKLHLCHLIRKPYSSESKKRKSMLLFTISQYIPTFERFFFLSSYSKKLRW